MFTGFDPNDGAPLFDTQEAATERAKMLKAWDADDDTRIFIHIKGVPLWFAHLVRDTSFWWLAYTELE